MNFKLVSIWSESDQIETELEFRRGAITQPNVPYLFASCCSAQTMSAREQSALQRAWSQAPRGHLSPWMEAKAWGLCKRRRAIVATMDLTAKNLHLLKSQPLAEGPTQRLLIGADIPGMDA